MATKPTNSSNGEISEPGRTRDFGKTGFRRVRRAACPVCGNTDTAKEMVLYDDRYGFPELFDVARCSACTAFFLMEYIDIEDIPRLYRQYYGKVPENPCKEKNRPLSNLRLRMRSTWLWQQVLGGTDLGRYPTRGDRVLDVGCGYGRNAFLVQSLGAEWIGLDVDSKVVNHLLEQGMTAVCATLEEYARTSPECFDTILLSQILEHVPEPIPFLRAAFDILKPGGRLYVSCPNSASRYRRKLGARWLHWHVPYHVLQWNRESLAKAAEQAGFVLQWFRARTPPSWYMMQRNFKSVERGCRNTSFRFKFKPLRWVAVFSWTILLDLLYPDSGDALVACLRKTERHP